MTKMTKKKETRDPTTKLFSTRVPEELITALKFKALKEKTSVQALVNQALEALLNDTAG